MKNASHSTNKTFWNFCRRSEHGMWGDKVDS